MIPETSLETNSIVVGAFKEAATAKVTVQNLRRNISVLLGAGGDIAVLTGPDGSCSSMRRSLPHDRTSLKLSRASTGIPSNN
jgi:hypothetical protein